MKLEEVHYLPRLEKVEIEGFRSVFDRVAISFPRNKPVILFGENNAGKSNIIRAIDTLLGERWPGTLQPIDQDFWKREKVGHPITLRAIVSDFIYQGGRYDGVPVNAIEWQFDEKQSGQSPFYKAYLETGVGRDDPVFLNTETREQLLSFILTDERESTYELSVARGLTLMGRFTKRMHERLSKEASLASKIKAQLSSQINVLEQFGEFKRFQNELNTMVNEFTANWLHGHKMNFTTFDPDNFFHSLRLMPITDGEVSSLSEMGSGQRQVLTITFAYVLAKVLHNNLLLIIEEPELHLHPLAQGWLASSITRLCNDSLQMVITTHSPEFVDILGFEGLVYVRSKDGKTVTKQLSSFWNRLNSPNCSSTLICDDN